MLRVLPLFLLLALIASCGDDSPDDAGETVDAGARDLDDSDATESDGAADGAGEADLPPAEPVVATVALTNPRTGAGVANATVTFADQVATTDVAGRAQVTVDSDRPFEIGVENDGFDDYYLVGEAGGEDFTISTLMPDQTTTTQVLNGLGLTQLESNGLVVVGVDTPELAPIAGAQVILDAEHGGSFVLNAIGAASLGDRTLDRGAGFVSFVNVPPGSARVVAIPPDQRDCRIYPSEGDLDSVTARAGAVTVVPFICR